MWTSETKLIVLFIVSFSLLILGLTGFIIMVIYKYKDRQSHHFRELESLKLVHTNQILQTQIEIQEQTFMNISRDIHDNVGQKLSLANLYLNSVSNTDSQIKNVSMILSDAITDLRTLSRSLSSEIIMSNGLLQAIESEIKLLKQTNLFDTEIKVFGEQVFLEESQDLLLFRIVQEALQNIIKHSKANEVIIELHYSPETFEAKIVDNGIGYEKGIKGGQGIRNMEARAKLLNGYFDITGHPNTGTIVKIKIPLDENE